MAFRAKELRIIDAAQYRRLYVRLSSRGWRTAEPHEPQHEAPELIQDTFAALRHRGVTSAQVARELHWEPETLAEVSGVPIEYASDEIIPLHRPD